MNLLRRRYLCQSLLWPDLILSGARRRKKSTKSMKRKPRSSARKRRNTKGYYFRHAHSYACFDVIFYFIVAHYQLTVNSSRRWNSKWKDCRNPSKTRQRILMKHFWSWWRRKWNVHLPYTRWAGQHVQIHAFILNKWQISVDFYFLFFYFLLHFAGRTQDYPSCLFSAKRRRDEK